MVTATLLFDLQNLDWELSAQEKSLAEVRDKLADNAALDSAKKELDRLESKLSEQASARRDVEITVQALDEKIRSVEGKLYGGSISSPRELSAFQDEKTMFQRLRSVEEDKLLELMVTIEDMQSQRDRTTGDLSAMENERSVEYPRLLDNQECLTKQLAELGEIRKDTTAQLAAASLSLYESLRKTRRGYAVAKVERGLCQGCRIALPNADLLRARNSQGIAQCSSCRRILYVA